jgi:hypothetical protein
MTAAELGRECDVFTRHISGRAPTPYVVRRYTDAHAVLTGLEPNGGHGRWLLRVARAGPMLCRVADGWARLAAPRSALRMKLVVLFAILEVSPPFAATLDQPSGGRAWEWARIVAAGVASLLALVVALVLFLPLRLVAGGRDR